MSQPNNTSNFYFNNTLNINLNNTFYHQMYEEDIYYKYYNNINTNTNTNTINQYPPLQMKVEFNPSALYEETN
jgi:hypothetical protein